MKPSLVTGVPKNISNKIKNQKEEDDKMAFCTNCGTKLDDGAKFCTNCGAKVGEEKTPDLDNTYEKEEPVQGAYVPPVEENTVGEYTQTGPTEGTYTQPTQGTYYSAAPSDSYDAEKAAARKKKNTIIVVAVCAVVVLAIALIGCIVSLIVKAGRDRDITVDSSYSSAVSESVTENSASSEPEKEAFVSPTTELKSGTYWYGFAEISNHEGNEGFSEGIYEVWGVIGTDSEGRTFFEVYEDYEMEGSPVLSYWVDLYSDFASADIGEEDAWLLDIYLIEEDEPYFSFWLENGAINIWFPYDFEGESFDFDLFMREEGAEWDLENDPYIP